MFPKENEGAITEEKRQDIVGRRQKQQMSSVIPYSIKMFRLLINHLKDYDWGINNEARDLLTFYIKINSR